ncbi:hypothetical protein CYMTET_26558 [Cymbomonas tetramitiformis]|uniref:L domain-like protein n=1 Tax=Cymbomonas tetramitiformis TaxID=36881 RepID=A0AAE0FSB6_9CHLO|nr:hypothetical protein CYMTET_26558 [Cymbomonas tetramitiformis]
MREATSLITVAWLSIILVPLAFTTTVEQTSTYQECFALSPNTCTSMQLQHNHLTGTLPTELGELTVMTEMRLQHNHLTGTLPTEMGKLTAMNALQLSDIRLTGTLPTELGELTAMTEMQLQHNRLTGTLPTELGELTAMNEIQLQHNRLTGTLPTELGELTAMNEISVSANPELCGEVPADVVVSSTTGTALGESCTAGVTSLVSPSSKEIALLALLLLQHCSRPIQAGLILPS